MGLAEMGPFGDMREGLILFSRSDSYKKALLGTGVSIWTTLILIVLSHSMSNLRLGCNISVLSHCNLGRAPGLRYADQVHEPLCLLTTLAYCTLVSS